MVELRMRAIASSSSSDEGSSTLQHAIAVVGAAAERFGGEVEEGRLFLAPRLAAAWEEG
jgi:hypothetical protein